MKPSKKTIKNRLDKVFSELIRSTGKCARCGRVGRVETSHHFSRRHLATRWLELNAIPSCHFCHREYHSNPADSAVWLEGYLGKEKLEELRRLKETTRKWSEAELLELEEELKEKLKSTL